MRYKSIFKPAIARKLLKMGNPIYDIKAQKEDSSKTIFIFENNEKLNKDLATIQNM